MNTTVFSKLFHPWSKQVIVMYPYVNCQRREFEQHSRTLRAIDSHRISQLNPRCLTHISSGLNWSHCTTEITFDWQAEWCVRRIRMLPVHVRAILHRKDPMKRIHAIVMRAGWHAKTHFIIHRTLVFDWLNHGSAPMRQKEVQSAKFFFSCRIISSVIKTFVLLASHEVTSSVFTFRQHLGHFSPMSEARTI